MSAVDEVVQEIRSLLAKYADQLSKEGTEEIERYLSHAEYEMAFEGFVLEVMTVPGVVDEDRRACLALARRLGLDKHSTFEPDVWQRLNALVGTGGSM